MKVYSGYATGYAQNLVKENAQLLARMIRKVKHTHGINTFVVHGNSGVSAGFAALMLENFNLVLVRKDNDASHGSPIEGPEGHAFDSYMVIDDFVSSGDTIHRIINKVHLLHEQSRNTDTEAPRCYGVLCYGSRNTDLVFDTKDGNIHAYHSDYVD